MPAGRPLTDGAPRDCVVSVHMTEADRKLIGEHAGKRGLKISEHIRDIVVRAAKGEIKIDTPVQVPLF